MATVNPYTDILSAAFRNLGQANADADYQQQQGKANLSRLLDIQNTNRGNAVTGSRQNASSHGLLDSSIALNQEAKVNQGFDQQNGMYTRSYDDLLHQLTGKRLSAQTAYDDAQTQFEKWKDIGPLSPDTPGTDPATVSTYQTDPGGATVQTGGMLNGQVLGAAPAPNWTPPAPTADTGYLGYTPDQWAAFMAPKSVASAPKVKAVAKPKAPVPIPVQGKKAVFS